MARSRSARTKHSDPAGGFHRRAQKLTVAAEERALFTEVWNEVVTEQRVSSIAVDSEYRATLAEWGMTISDAETATAEEMREQMMPQQEQVIAKYKLDPELVDLATAAAE